MSVITSGAHNGTTWLKPLLLRKAGDVAGDLAGDMVGDMAGDMAGDSKEADETPWKQGDVVRLRAQV